MNRPLFAWSIYGICLLLTFAAVSWLTRSAWQADHARQQALLDSEIQNALWQLDSLVAPLLAIEINRPSLRDSFSNSPMLDPKFINGYVVCDEFGHWTIRRDGRATRHLDLPPDCPLLAEDWESRLRATQAETDVNEGSTRTVGPGDQYIFPVAGQGGQIGGGQVGGQSGGFGGGQFGQMAGGQGGQSGGIDQSGIRSQLVQQFQQVAAAQTHRNPLTPMQPIWVKNELVFARRIPNVKGPETTIVEICWLNWKEWEILLTAQLDQTPIPLQLQPYDNSASSHVVWQPNSRQMVSMPVRLEPKSRVVPGTAPRSLIAVWVLLGLVAIASAWLLRQTLNLSERRAAFVSAVTHELRTPLTTFRLYTEMLSEGIASEPEQQQAYFQTLNREANRLTHLVENVLAYARLEHGRSTARTESLTLGDLLERCRSRLEQRVAETPLSISYPISELTKSTTLTTNAMAVEQILFNLIDNACKYACDAIDPRIVLEARKERNQICIEVTDFGPGLSIAARRTLFHPFHKSSSQAAETAPGIGLGLALSHRLARELEGSLKCYPNKPTGLCMQLRLPLAMN